MKKHFSILFLIVILLLAGCGGQEVTQSGEFYDIKVTSKQVFPVLEEENCKFLGTQYYLGEPIQLWGKTLPEEKVSEVYLYREDGSRELLLQGISSEYLYAGEWWMDEEGAFFILQIDAIMGLDKEGKELFCKSTESNIYAICQTQDGEVAIAVDISGVRKLVYVDRQTGRFDEKCTIDEYASLMAGSENGVLLLDYSGLYEMNPEDGRKTYYLRWEGTSFSWCPRFTERAIRFHLENGVEILHSDGSTECIQSVPMETDKKVITIRNAYFSPWIKEQIVLFNRTNQDYYVVISEKPEDMDLQDFRQQTDRELAAGIGADIIGENCVGDCYSLLEKGTFAELQDYMKTSDISPEEYLPLTFSYWAEAEKIYGVNIVSHPRVIWMKEEVAGNSELTIDTLLIKLQTYQEDAVFAEGYGAGDVAEFLLQGSDSLWGMVDWESGTCDFSGELFQDIIATAVRYGDDERNGYPALTGYAICDKVSIYLVNRYVFPQEEKVYSGYLFDDGCHAWMIPEIFAVNAKSKNKEGAWALLYFLLQEEAQSELAKNTATVALPSNRKAFEALLEEERAKAVYSIIPTLESMGFSVPEIKEEELDAYIEELYHLTETAEPFPMRTGPILVIIREELQDYFAGNKPYDEVIGVIENRVQLYLDEQ